MIKRQGDILFVNIEEIPKEMKIKEDNIIAEGEATGHKHLLEDGILYEDSKGTLFIKVEKESAKVVHQEHSSIILPEGHYKVVRQREYKPNVLIVDDEETVRKSLTFALENDFNVKTAENVEDAMRKINKNNIDVVILDIMMPVMNGFEVLRMIRETEKDIKVIIMSGRLTDEIEREAKQLGAFDCIQKPFDVCLLLEIIQNAIQKILK